MSRLAGSGGRSLALRLHRALLLRLTADLRRLGLKHRAEFRVTPSLRKPAVMALLGSGWSVKSQAYTGGQLGPRIVGVLRASKGPCLLMGADSLCPASLLFRAYRQSVVKSFALGPSRDGGFWAIAVRNGQKISPRVFQGQRWSHSKVFEECKARLQFSGSFLVLDQSWDLDELRDWQDWQKASGQSWRLPSCRT